MSHILPFIVTQGGSDSIHGGAGIDTALFFDNRSNFTITTLAGITHVKTLSSAESQYYSVNSPQDTILTSIEKIQFIDGSVNAGNKSPTGIVTINNTTPAQGQTLIASNSFADLEGLDTISYVWKTGTTVLGTDSYTVT